MKRYLTKKNIVIVLLLVLVFWLFAKPNTTGKAKTATVKKVEITNRAVNVTVSAPGKIVSENEANLSFAGSQRIAALAVKEGQTVKKGELLAYLDTQALMATLQSYKDTRDVAKRQEELFVLDEDSNKETLGGDEQYQIKLREYKESSSKLEYAYQAQLAGLRGSYIYAPFDGTIVDLPKKVGETVSAGETIVKIADMSSLRFEIALDQEDFGDVSMDMKAEINLDAYPTTKIFGKVTSISQFVDDPASGSFKITLSFDNFDDFKPALGMTGDAKILVQSSQGEVSSLYYDELFFDEEDNPFVWVEDNGYVSKFPIEIGLEGDIYTEIKTKVDKTIIVPLTTDIEIKDGYKTKIAK